MLFLPGSCLLGILPSYCTGVLGLNPAIVLYWGAWFESCHRIVLGCLVGILPSYCTGVLGLLGLQAVKLTSTKTQLPYEYYSLPFCQPDGGIVYKTENLGTYRCEEKSLCVIACV